MATRPIDEKIVAMRMDNSDFVNKAAETTKSMGKLTSFLNKIPGINLGKTTSELQNINKSVNGIEVSRLSSAIDSITSRFSTLGIVGTTALMNITNRAVDAGLAMVKNLTVKPITDGFSEYELQMGSIQTILANTSRYGTDVADVSKALGELNEYADKTIYNFGEMTKNIGLFTNAGLELDASVSMIKGFSNAAAASGANAENAARAAFQLSQGLSQGYLMQMDWMSLTNAGMGNDNMKRDLIALGQAMGTLDVSTETAIKDWKELLSDEQWLTTDVMSTYLQSMAGEIDKATLKTIGLTDAQADLLIQNAKTGEESATYVRTFTQMMGTLVEGVGSGWSESFSIIFGEFEQATKLWTGFSELLGAPFEALTKSRNKFFQSLKNAGVFEEIFVTMGTALYVVGQVVESVAGGFDKAFSSDKVGLISALTNGFGKMVSFLTPSQASLDKISLIFQSLGSNVRVVFKVLGEVGGLLLKLVPDNLGSSLLGILSGFAKLNISFNDGILKGNILKGVFENLGKAFSWTGDRLNDVMGLFSQLGDRISEVWSILRSGEAATNGSFDKDSKIVVWLAAISEAAKSVIEYVGNIELSLTPIMKSFDAFFSAIGTGFNWLKEKFSGAGEAIRSVLPSGTDLMAGGFVAALLAIVGIAFKRMNDLSKIFSEWGNIVTGFADTLDSVSGALDAFSLNIKSKALLTAAFAVGVLSASIFLMSKVDGSKIGMSLTAIVGALMAVIGAMAVMTKFDITGGLRTSASIIGIAVALSVMSIALKRFGDLKPNELTKGLIAMTVVMGAIAGAFALMGKFNDKQMAVSALQIVAISVAVLIIAKAVKDMSSLKPAELTKGLVGLTTMLLAISGAFALMGKFSGGAASSLQLVAMAGSILLMVGAIKLIANIETSDLLIGLGTITLILMAIAGFSILTSGTGLLASAVGLLAISVAMNALIVPIFALGNFPIGSLIQGLVGMSLALLALAGASKLMAGSIGSAIGLIGMAVALNLLIIPIAAFAAMGWGPMLTGVAGMAISLAALAGVSLLLAPATVPLLLFSAAIAALGLGMLAAGAGMTLFATGILGLAGMTSAAIATIVATLGTLIAGLASLIPTAVKFVANIITEIAETIREKAPIIIGIIIETIINILTTIASYIPQYIKAVVKIITSIIDAIAEEGPKLIASVVNLLITLVETMAKTIDDNGPRFVNAFLGLVGSILTIVVETGTAVIKAMMGWIPGVEKAMDKVASSAGDAIDKALETAKIGEEKGAYFATGLNSSKSVVQASAQGLSTAANSGLNYENSSNSGSAFASNFASGITSSTWKVESASKQMANAALKANREELGIHSNSDETISDGKYVGGGFIEGMDSTSGKVEKSAKNMGNSALSGIGSVTDMIRGKLFLNDSDVKDNDKKTKAVSKSYSKSGKDVEKSSKKTSKAVKKELDAQFVKAKELIDEQKYYQKLSLEEELKAWQNIQKKYKIGSEERKQADREVFRVQQDLIKQKSTAEKAAIEEQKYYQKMSLEEELAAWKNIQKQYKVGSEDRKHADREVYRVQQELIKKKTEAEKDSFNHSKEWIDKEKTFKKMSLADELAGWERIQKRYKTGTEERKEADRELLRIKNEINQQLISLNDEYVTKMKDANKKLIEDEKQLNAEYKRTYDDRVKSLTNFVGLFDKVKERDAENPVTGNQLVENLRGQVNSLGTWSDDLQRLAQKGIDDGLLSELEAMGPSAALEIAALNDLTAGQLDQYVGLWQTKSKLAATQASRELQPLKEETSKAIIQLRKDTGIQLDEYKGEWIKKIAEIRTGSKEGFVGLTTDMKTIGKNAIQGLMKGLGEEEPVLYSRVQQIAKGIEQTIKDTLKIKSPSRIMMAIGGFVGQGLADGISKSSNIVGEKSKALALKARDSINEFLSTMTLPDVDNEIRFKAVLDDSEITNGMHSLSKANIPYSLGTTNGLISSVKAGMVQNGNKTPRTDISQTSTNDGLSGQNSKQPVIIQSILNGRVIAEETFSDISQLIGATTNLNYLMKGV